MGVRAIIEKGSMANIIEVNLVPRVWLQVAKAKLL